MGWRSATPFLFFPYALFRLFHVRMRLQLLVLALTAVASIPGAVSAQPVARFGGPVADADMLYFAGHPEEAYDLLTKHLEKDSTDYNALWRAARAAVALELLDKEDGRQYRWLDPAIRLGDRAVAERPEGVEGLYWRGAAEGRRALYAGNSYAAELAQRVYDDAHAILAIDSLHGGAHNLLGKLNYEIMSMSRVERFLGKLMVHSEALSSSSWEAAESNLLAATKEWPNFVIFEYDLAQLYRKRGRKDEARDAYRRVTEMPEVHPEDGFFKAEARRQLEELGS